MSFDDKAAITNAQRVVDAAAFPPDDVWPDLLAVTRTLAARVEAVEALAQQWTDLLRTESEIMTTPQRNAWADALAELRGALGLERSPA